MTVSPGLSPRRPDFYGTPGRRSLARGGKGWVLLLDKVGTERGLEGHIEAGQVEQSESSLQGTETDSSRNLRRHRPATQFLGRLWRHLEKQRWCERMLWVCDVADSPGKGPAAAPAPTMARRATSLPRFLVALLPDCAFQTAIADEPRLGSLPTD